MFTPFLDAPMAKWKNTRRSLRRPFETGGFLLLKTVVPVMPRGMVAALSRLAGHMAMLLPLREKKTGLKNMDAVFGPDMNAADKRAILRSSFSTFCQTMLDVFWFSKNPEERILKYVAFEEGPFKDALFEDKPAICITAHMGSWEIMGQTCALMGIRIASIAATVKNPVVDRILIEQRERTGQIIIPQKGALKSLIAWFRKNGKAAFVLDQNTSESEGGIVVDFLGFPMPVSSAPAALAYRTGTEITFGFCLPEPNGRYRIRITQTITPPPFDKNLDANEVARTLTQQIQDVLSDEIRKHPHFWLWSYKHWRRVPGRTYPDNYPRY
jgi:KDO2-lipid IV(A) lauroyltransferase